MTGLTVPVSALDLLGELQGSDPAVRWREDGFEASWHPRDSSDRSWPDSGATRLLVEQSEPALLRVLARHLGWDGKGRPALQAAHGSWFVYAVQDKFKHLLAWRADIAGHISADLGYHEALAAAVAWYARSARCEKATGLPADDRLLERWNDDSSSMWSLLIEAKPLPDVLVAIEQHLGLPPIEVLP